MKLTLIFLIFLPQPALAEVSDKMTTIPAMWIQGLVVAIVLFLLVRRHIWASGFGVLVVVFFAYASYSTFDDPYIGPAIIKEQGWPYVTAAYGSTALMGLGLLGGIYLNRRRNK